MHSATCFHICVQDTTLFPSIEQRPVLFDQRCVGVGGIDTCHNVKKKSCLFAPKSYGNNAMDVMDIMDVLSRLHPHSNPGWPKGTTTSQCMGVKGAIRLMLRACLVSYQRLALWYIFTKRW